MLDQPIAFIAPFNCISCSVEGSLLCDWCRPELYIQPPSRCFLCHAATQDYATCRRCKPKFPIEHVWVTTSYDKLAKEILKKYKFERAQSACVIISHIMTDSLPYLPKNIVVSHVPTASTRVRARGYDQSKLLAKHIAGSVGRVHETLLVRLGQTRQVGSKRVDRYTQVEQVFTARMKSSKKHVLLVDDVATTGATLTAAAKVLRADGTVHVDAVVFAQAL